MFKCSCAIRSSATSFEIARRTTALAMEEVTPVLGAEQILELQNLVRKVPVSDHIIRYTLALVRQTRIGEPGRAEVHPRLVVLGAPGRVPCRTSSSAPMARALLKGRVHVQTRGHSRAGVSGAAASHPDTNFHGRVGRHHA